MIFTKLFIILSQKKYTIDKFHIMATTRLGIDLGTSSIGWAVVKQDEGTTILVDKGVDIFQDGVVHTKSGEEPAVNTRTRTRALRRHYFRRRLRKIELLKVLIDCGWCPALTDEQLDVWRRTKKYPLDDDFLAWQRTDDNIGKNPYFDRFTSLTRQLDLTVRSDRYILGRAMYHLAQRRGFMSNRKDTSEDSDGKVKGSIKALSEDMQAAGCQYLGEYFYKLYGNTKIRNHYTAREEHYLAEFDAICDRQQLSADMRKRLYDAIFYQRPLKSQKGLVGRCTFDKNKSRCPTSHPRFEEYRKLCFINDIKVKRPTDSEYLPLNGDERKAIEPLFLRKAKSFDFEDIAKKVSGKKKGGYGCREDKTESPYMFNYRMKTDVSGCPVTAELASVFDETPDWLDNICSHYTLGAGKTREQILGDVWHAMFSFDDDKRLKTWATEHLNLNEDKAKKFVNIRMPQDYAALSLSVINKMLPYLRQGFRYDEAVFFANMRNVIPAEKWNDDDVRNNIEAEITEMLNSFRPNPYMPSDTKEARVKDCLIACGIEPQQIRMEKLYHPSMIEQYHPVRPDENGIVRLGSPRTSSVRNPMAMRALFRLRILMNKLLAEGKINAATKINIEFARSLNDTNTRRAIEDYQRENKNARKKAIEEIKLHYFEATGKEIEPSEDDLIKYKCWEEQNHHCLYTGNEISLPAFLGTDPLYDIEHTVPRSRGGDDSQENKTLCERRFNREIKREKLPSQLDNHAEIMARIESLGWEEQIKRFNTQIDIQLRKSKQASTKEAKDSAVRMRHLLKMKRDYLRGKYERFTMKDVPEGFSNRQGVDIGIIGKYARLYLKSFFNNVYTVKGKTTADFRKAWGLQEEFAKKERVNHVHHCIDAITIACIGSREYDRWAHYQQEVDDCEFYGYPKPHFDKPWPTFTEDVKAVTDELLVSHHTPDNMAKVGRKRLRKRGKVQLNADGQEIWINCHSARGSLHQDAYYGAIERDEQIKYVIRKPLDALEAKDIKNIVDEAVRQKVQQAVDEQGESVLKNPDYTIWMNQDKGVPIKRVRLFATNVTKPIDLKQQRDLSVKKYKQYYHVVNDGNYCMAIYEGTDSRGKLKRSFKLLSNLEATKFFNKKTDRHDLVPLSDDNNLPLKCILKTGTMVLFYENSPEELYDCPKSDLVKRLYKVKSMAKEGRITFIYHQDARADELVSAECGMGFSKFEQNVQQAKLRLSVSNINAFVEGYDFALTVTGEIKFKH